MYSGSIFLACIHSVIFLCNELKKYGFTQRESIAVLSAKENGHLEKVVSHQERLPLYPVIAHTSGLVNGSPRIANRLLPVRDIVHAVRNYESVQQVADEYCINRSDIRQALQYCASLQCTKDKPGEFCHRCSLKRQQKGALNMSELEEVVCNKTSYVRGKDSLFLGTLKELLDDWNGEDWWTIAVDLLIDYRADLLEEDSR